MKIPNQKQSEFVYPEIKRDPIVCNKEFNQMVNKNIPITPLKHVEPNRSLWADIKRWIVTDCNFKLGRQSYSIKNGQIVVSVCFYAAICLVLYLL